MRIPDEPLAAYLQGGLHYAGSLWHQWSAEQLSAAADGWLFLLNKGVDQLPLHVAVDLWGVVWEGLELRLSSSTGQHGRSDADQRLVERWEHELLDPLSKDPRVLEAWEAARFSPVRPRQTQRLLLLLARQVAAQAPPAPTFSLPAARRMLRPIITGGLDLDQLRTAADEFCAWAGDASFYRRQLEELLNGCLLHLRWSALLDEEDFFELRHLDSLDNDFLRIGCRQLIALQRQQTPFDVRRVAHVREEAEAETAFVDESSYPAGGFAGLTNRGSFENLVLSELAYMDPSQPVNLFDLRFVEGELLYFTRDEGVLLRRRRTVHVVFDLGDLFHSRLPGYRFQFGVLAQALCLRMLGDLLAVFAHDSVRAVVHYLHGGAAAEPMEQESRLLRLLLADAIEHQWATVRVAAQLDWDELRDRRRKQYLLVVAGDSAEQWRRQLAAAAQADPPVMGAVLQAASGDGPSGDGPSGDGPSGDGPSGDGPSGDGLWRLPPAGLEPTELSWIKDEMIQHVAR